MILFVAKRMSNGGYGHEHVVRLWWEDTNDGTTGNFEIADAIRWLDDPNVHAFVRDPLDVRIKVEAFVCKLPNGAKYIRTKSDGRLTNNLLALPDR